MHWHVQFLTMWVTLMPRIYLWTSWNQNLEENGVNFTLYPVSLDVGCEIVQWAREKKELIKIKLVL